MATRDVFSAEELARLRGFPEITRAELIRYFTVTRADEAFLRKFHTRANVLGASVQLATLPWLGFVPDEVTSAPPAAVGRLAGHRGRRAGRVWPAGANPYRASARDCGLCRLAGARWAEVEGGR